MSLRRFGRKIKQLSEKGAPSTPRRRIVVLINAFVKKQDFHYTKGWRRTD
jgi:hypothetical protein